MARNWTIHHGNPDFDFLQTMEDALSTSNIINENGTKVVIGGGGHKVVFTGHDFMDIDGTPGPESGTITGIKVFDHGTLVAEATGYALDVTWLDAPFNNLIKHGDFSSFHGLFFGSGGPRIVVDGSDDRDVLDAPADIPFTFRGNGGNDKFVGSRSGDKIFGGADNDLLKGRDGEDLMKGGSGNDKLFGGEEDDHLFGGSGNDAFVFDVALGNGFLQAGVDHIDDFTPGEDVIKLAKSVFAGIGNVLDANEFHIGGNAQDANDHILYKANTGALFYDPDGDGIKGKIKFAVLDNKPDLSHDDFIMI